MCRFYRSELINTTLFDLPKMIKNLVLLLCAFLLACHNSSYNFNQTTDYSIETDYSDNLNRNWEVYFDKKISTDSLYIFIESDFTNSYLEIYPNEKIEVIDSINTDSILDMAGVYEFGNINHIKSFGLRINQGRLLLIEPHMNQNIWVINFEESKVLKASYSEHAPFYD